MTPEQQLQRWQLVVGADVGAVQYIPAVEELQVGAGTVCISISACAAVVVVVVYAENRGAGVVCMGRRRQRWRSCRWVQGERCVADAVRDHAMRVTTPGCALATPTPTRPPHAAR